MASLATTIIVHVIGLAVFSRQFGPQHGPLQALLPLVSGHTAHRAQLPSSTDTPTPTGGIEPHTAIILFPANSYVSGHGWTHTTFPTDSQWKYVVLNGDQITFSDSAATQKDTSGANTTRARAALGKVRQPVDAEPVDPPLVSDDIGLPSLKNCFSATKLKAAYRPPNFTGAAAVLTFPAKVEKASACSQDPSKDTSRTDTQVKLPLYGDLVISATNPGPQRDLVLRGAGKVIIGNIPSRILTGADTAGYSDLHYEIYAEMGDGTTGDFSCAKLDAVPLCEGATPPFAGRRRGGDSANPKGNARYSVTQGPDFPPISDYRCSNTQWP